MKKILVIGGYGFIGSHLSSSYEEDGNEVYRTSRFYDIDEDSKSYQSDYSKPSFVEILSKDRFDLIFYLSGNPYPEFSENGAIYDVEQTIKPLVSLLDALVETRFKGSLWFASSVAVYGKTEKEFQSESDICQPLSSYALAKITGEEYLKLFASKHDLSCGSLRIFSTFGEGLKRQIVYDLYKKAYTPWEWHKPIIERAAQLGLICFSSPFDESAVDFLNDLDVPAFKIASFENNHTPLIAKAA